MTARLKRKAAIMIVVELIFLSLVGVLLTNMQTDLSLNDQRDNIAEKLDEMDELIAAGRVHPSLVIGVPVGFVHVLGVEITEAFDEENHGKVGSAAFMYQNGVLTGYSRANMQLLTDLLDVDNVIILDKSGHALAQSGDSPADFTRSRYNQLRTVTLNYENLVGMYFARRAHKLDEWHVFCAWAEELPYFKTLFIENDA